MHRSFDLFFVVQIFLDINFKTEALDFLFFMLVHVANKDMLTF